MCGCSGLATIEALSRMSRVATDLDYATVSIETRVRCDEARCTTITAYPLLIFAVGSMKVAGFDCGVGQHGSIRANSGIPDRTSCSNEKSSAFDTYGGHVPL